MKWTQDDDEELDCLLKMDMIAWVGGGRKGRGGGGKGHG